MSAPVRAETRGDGPGVLADALDAAPPSAAALARALAALQARDAALAAQLAAAERDAAHLRAGIGDAVAEGQNPSDLRMRLRDADDRADGLRRGRTRLAADTATLTAEQGAAALREAREAERAAIADAVALGERADAALGAFLADTFAPLDAALVAAADRVHRAEDEAARRAGSTVLGAGAFYARVIHPRPRLHALLAALRPVVAALGGR